MIRMSTRRVSHHKLAILFFSLVIMVGSHDVRAQAREAFTDKVYLKNGDRITGNIKELDRGKLRVKTQTMDTIYLNWIEVESIDSSSFLRVTHADGSIQTGRVQASEIDKNVRLLSGGQAIEIPTLEIVSMKPIRVNESFWHRIEGDASIGIDYKKASEILLVNVASNLRLREEKYELGFAFNWNETQRTEENNSSRADLNAEYTRFLGERWFWKASGGFQRNQELGIDLRSIISGSAGKYFIQTSTMRFEVNAGIAASAEDRTDNTTQQSVEGVINSSFDLFQLNIPITRLSANISIYPGITESDRIRVNSDITLRNELMRDFFWDLSFYSSYDNQPVPGAVESDFGVVTSLGATF